MRNWSVERVTARIEELRAEANEYESTGSYALARVKRGDAEFYRRVLAACGRHSAKQG